VLEYLGRYTRRVAISNTRLLRLEEGQVSFAWKDYRARGGAGKPGDQPGGSLSQQTHSSKKERKEPQNEPSEPN
jgi:hypothetical protein